jgi:hypothetical protein
VAVVTSMHPAVTVALAGLVLRERIAGRQAAGLAIAAGQCGADRARVACVTDEGGAVGITVVGREGGEAAWGIHPAATPGGTMVEADTYVEVCCFPPWRAASTR